MSVPGWKKTFTTAPPATEMDSVCSMLSTDWVIDRSALRVIRLYTSGAGSPL